MRSTQRPSRESSPLLTPPLGHVSVVTLTHDGFRAEVHEERPTRKRARVIAVYLAMGLVVMLPGPIGVLLHALTSSASVLSVLAWSVVAAPSTVLGAFMALVPLLLLLRTLTTHTFEVLGDSVRITTSVSNRLRTERVVRLADCTHAVAHGKTLQFAGLWFRMPSDSARELAKLLSSAGIRASLDTDRPEYPPEELKRLRANYSSQPSASSSSASGTHSS